MKNTSDLDWRWLKSFVSVCEAGNMQAAAKESGISQPTLSRHIRALEEYVGVSIFERDGRELVLSEHGAELFERAKEIRKSVGEFELRAFGVSDRKSGPVRVTMTEIAGAFFAPNWVREFRDAHPHITIDLSIDNRELSLLLREAEIAVREFVPTQLDLVQKHIGNTTLGMFASKGYLKRRGTPKSLDELYDHDLIGFDRITAWIEGAKAMGYTYTREHFSVRTDSTAFHVLGAEEGNGIAVVPIPFAKRRPKLVRLFPTVIIPGPPIYLTAHPDLRKNPRVSAVWEDLSRAITELFAG